MQDLRCRLRQRRSCNSWLLEPVAENHVGGDGSRARLDADIIDIPTFGTDAGIGGQAEAKACALSGIGIEVHNATGPVLQIAPPISTCQHVASLNGAGVGVGQQGRIGYGRPIASAIRGYLNDACVLAATCGTFLDVAIVEELQGQR